MKKVIVFLFFSQLLLGCNEIRRRDLYEKTDFFVESLYTQYESYGLFGGEKYTQYADKGKYRVMPVGRLINVRIEQYASSMDYEELRKSLESHYSGNSRVNSVYICEGGTVMIDCRN